MLGLQQRVVRGRDQQRRAERLAAPATLPGSARRRRRARCSPVAAASASTAGSDADTAIRSAPRPATPPPPAPASSRRRADQRLVRDARIAARADRAPPRDPARIRAAERVMRAPRRQTRQNTPGAARIGWRSRHGVSGTGDAGMPLDLPRAVSRRAVEGEGRAYQPRDVERLAQPPPPRAISRASRAASLAGMRRIRLDPSRTNGTIPPASHASGSSVS